MKIGRLAQRTGCAVETIRYYEKVGLIPEPRRTAGNYRDYGASVAERLGFIRNCRSLDMTLDEIRQLLAFRDRPDASCADVNQLVDEHIDHVTARIEALRELESQLRGIREQCAQARTVRDCGILSELARAEPRVEDDHLPHVDGAHQAGPR